MEKELSHQQREHQKLAANRPKTDAEREHVKRVVAVNTLSEYNVGNPGEHLITATAARLTIINTEVDDPTDERPTSDVAHRKLTIYRVAYIRRDGSEASTAQAVKDLFNASPELFPHVLA